MQVLNLVKIIVVDAEHTWQFKPLTLALSAALFGEPLICYTTGNYSLP